MQGLPTSNDSCSLRRMSTFKSLVLAVVAGLSTLMLASALKLLDTSTSYTVDKKVYDAKPNNSGCTTLYKGCTGSIATKMQEVAGTVTVIDDCTFEVTGWEFNGQGPALVWYGAPADEKGNPKEFPY